MDNFESLWAYQVEDMKADAIANEIKRSPIRVKLEKSRDFILECKKKYAQIEEEISAMADRKDVIADALTHSEEQLNALQAKVTDTPPQTAEEARELINEVAKCRENIMQYETEIRRIVKESNSHEQRQRSVRLEAAKAKQTFDQLKVSYDAESQEKKNELETQKAKVKEMAAGVDAALMETYLSIKKHITPPIARLTHGQCSGCNTAIPSAVLSKIRNGSMVECETCGRIIIQ